MWQFLQTPSAQAVISVTILLVLLVIFYYVVRKFRDRTDQDTMTGVDLLTNFREMRHEGDITDREYRNIKTVLGAELQTQLSDNDDKT